MPAAQDTTPTPAPGKKAITLTDVAARAGVSRATASMGLRNSPKIAPATRSRIHKAAQELNYWPDPMLAALVTRRNHRRTPANLAVVIDDCWLGGRAGEDDSWLHLCLEGMHSTARLHGYALEEVLLEKHLYGWKNPNRVLKARGTCGIIVLPFRNDKATLPALDWKHYSLLGVGVGDPAYAEQWHRIAVDAYSSAHLACSMLKQRGIRRIGLAQQFHLLQRHRYEWLAGLSKEWHLSGHQGLEYVPPYLPEHIEKHSFVEWVLHERPEAVITPEPQTIQWIRDAGLRVPEDVRVALITNTNDPNAGGIVLNIRELGEGAVDFMHGLILRGEIGIPPRSRELLIRPHWNEGPTVSPSIPETSAP